jgi:hypothetical protein
MMLLYEMDSNFSVLRKWTDSNSAATEPLKTDIAAPLRPMTGIKAILNPTTIIDEMMATSATSRGFPNPFSNEPMNVANDAIMDDNTRMRRMIEAATYSLDNSERTCSGAIMSNM